MRQCPTPEGGPGQRPLIAHQIPGCVCVERQQEHYHKCHRCVFRGKPVEFVLPETIGVSRNGSLTPNRIGEPLRNQLGTEQVLELPTRNGTPAKPLPDKV